ncbi:MAG: nitroreductase family protein [Phycisphaerae bacterium]|nr:nitroreductase family protein [Phycisphaerae bacterium]
MDVYEAIRKRFSVRAYADRPVDDDQLQRVLEAARQAPSARNRQPWHFVVVRQAETRKKLADLSGQGFLAEAPVVLAVVGTSPESVMHCGVPADPVDCAIAIDHLTLAATAEGLGTCWVGHFPQDPCRDLLGVPQAAKIIELVALGHPAGQRPASKTRKPLDEIVRHERYA